MQGARIVRGKRAEKGKAIAYLRTSSAANVGADKDSENRQRSAIEAFAKLAGFEIVAEFYDAAVSGAETIDARPGFAELLKRIEGNGVRTIVVETANRFARDLIVQETGYAMLRERGINLIAVDSPNAFLDDGPTSKLIRQVLGAVAEFDKAMTVAKLRGARERLRRSGRRVEGRTPAHVLYPKATAEAKRLRRANPKNGERRSFRDISADLAKAGLTTKAGKPFTATAVKRMVEGPVPEKGR